MNASEELTNRYTHLKKKSVFTHVDLYVIRLLRVRKPEPQTLVSCEHHTQLLFPSFGLRIHCQRSEGYFLKKRKERGGGAVPLFWHTLPQCYGDEKMELNTVQFGDWVTQIVICSPNQQRLLSICQEEDTVKYSALIKVNVVSQCQIIKRSLLSHVVET